MYKEITTLTHKKDTKTNKYCVIQRRLELLRPIAQDKSILLMNKI